MDAVVRQKERPFCGNIGARKIGFMSGVDVSAPTVYKALRAAGYGSVRKQKGKHIKRYSRPTGNDQWNIDFVEIGIDVVTRKKVESLSVTDDHSRYAFSFDATIGATMEHVFDALEGLFRRYGHAEGDGPLRIREGVHANALRRRVDQGENLLQVRL